MGIFLTVTHSPDQQLSQARAWVITHLSSPLKFPNKKTSFPGGDFKEGEYMPWISFKE